MALLATWTPAGSTLESWSLRLAGWYAPAQTSAAQVGVIGLNGDGPAALRRQAAAAILRLRALGAETLGLLLPLHQPTTLPTLTAARRHAERLTGDSGDVQSLRRLLGGLDADAALTGALQTSAGVVIAAYLQAGDAMDSAAAPRPALASLLQPAAASHALAVPLPAFQRHAAAVGIADQDTGFGVPTRIQHGSGAIPGLAVAMARRLGRLPGDAVGAGVAQAAAEATEQRFYRHPGIRPEDVVSFHGVERLLNGDHDAALTQRPLLLGPARSDGERRALVELGASLAALMAGRGIDRPVWFHAALRAALLSVGLYLLLLPRRLRGWPGVALSAALAAALVNAGALAVLVRGLWLPAVGPAVLLVAAHSLAAFGHRRAALLEAARSDACSARCELGAALQEQGRLDAAFTELRRCGSHAQAVEALQQLGLEYERRRQLPKALAVYDHLQAVAPGLDDVHERRQHLRTVIDHLPAVGNLTATSTVNVDDATVEKSSLGRYRLQRLLGRGAMGAVYLGEDPQIGRQVAVKVLPLTAEFEGKALQEARSRLRREAEAAGRLQHPNIITVFDVGEEHDLAYIAMDYAEGRNLEAFTESGNLLPVRDALAICASVAEALDYAHGQRVVHRDIKPSNIVYQARSGMVKVTDFGVASLTDARKTRTGAVLGSPAYMSPEQVAGRRLDGRSDLFSLGVTLYQLLTGALPFAGDSLATISYRIVEQRHVPIAKLRKGLPTCAGRIVNKALQKDPAKRYASGAEMAAALRRCGGIGTAR